MTVESLNSHPKAMQQQAISFRRELVLWNLVSYVLDAIIGPGIFISPSSVLYYAGSPGAALLVWFLCGLVATMVALCFVELATTFQNCGSSYIYVKLAFGDFAAFLFEWVDVILRKSTTICIRYLTFSLYLLQPLYGDCRPPMVPVRLMAAVGLIAIAFVNALGVNVRTGLQTITTVSKLFAVSFVIIVGFYYYLIGFDSTVSNPFSGSSSFGDVTVAFSYGLFAYSGWDMPSSAVEETKRPERNLLLAVAISLPLVTVLYVLMNIAFFLVLTHEELLASEAVAAVYFSKVSSIATWFVSLLICMAVLGCCNSVVFQTSRHYFACAREGQLPRFLSGLSSVYNTPQPALITMSILVLICLWLDNINQLLAYYGFLKLSMVVLPLAAQIYLRFREPDRPRPVKIPMVFLVATLLVVCCLLFVPLYRTFYNSIIAVGLSFLCIPVYLLFFVLKYRIQRLNTFLNTIDMRLASFFQKLLLVEIYQQEVVWKHIRSVSEPIVPDST